MDSGRSGQSLGAQVKRAWVFDETDMVLTMGVAGASCSGSTLLINVRVASQNQKYANLHLIVSKAGNQMTTVTTGSSKGEVIKETEVCE